MSLSRFVSSSFARALGLSLVAFTSACGGTPRATGGEPISPSSAQVSGAGSPVDGALRAALAGPARLESERARDGYRHPRETLEFFGLRDDMNVVELWGAGGYYTSILAPLLRERGKLAVTLFDPKGDPKAWQTQESAPYAARMDKSPEVFGKVERIIMTPPQFSFGPDRSADMVLTFRNVHNWLPEKYPDEVFAAAFRVLKPGGVLGVVDHRGKPGMTAKEIEDSGYIPEDVVLALATKAGFKLADRSEINANPKDTKDYPKGVWSLPPTFANKDVDRAKYAAIGESDRMTFKFVKP